MQDNLQKQLEELYLEIDALQELHRTNKILFYRPIGQQPDFHAASTASVRLVLGSNRSGKSVSGVVEAIAHSLGYRPWLAEDHPDRVVRLPTGEPIPIPNVGRVVAENFQTAIRQTIWPKYQEWLPAGALKTVGGVKNDQRGIVQQLTFDNGSIVHFMSYDQDDEVFEGTSGHWFWCDEPPPYGKYIGLKRGLVDFGGHCWLTMTPLSEPWINDLIVDRAGDPDSGVRVFHYHIMDNAISKGGYLPDVAIQEFIADLREDERAARIDGTFLHLAGRVFKEWRADPPYWIDPFRIPMSWPRVCVVDPHPRKPVAVLWAACDPDNQWYVYRDLFDEALRTVGEVSDRIKKCEGWRRDSSGQFQPTDSSEPVCLRIIDTSANQTERTSGENIRERFGSEGLYFRNAYKQNKEAGFDAIHDALKLRGLDPRPSLVVFNTCRHVKRNMQNFVWDSWANSRAQDKSGDKQEARKIWDDFIDCIRYIYQARLNYTNLRAGLKQYLIDDHEDDGGSFSFKLDIHSAGMQRLERNREGNKNITRTGFKKWGNFSISSRNS